MSKSPEPRWAEGVPYCSADPSPAEHECCHYDSKRCELLGWRPDSVCIPAVRRMVRLTVDTPSPTQAVVAPTGEAVVFTFSTRNEIDGALTGRAVNERACRVALPLPLQLDAVRELACVAQELVETPWRTRNAEESS